MKSIHITLTILTLFGRQMMEFGMQMMEIFEKNENTLKKKLVC